MIIAALSDIHSNFSALQACLAEAERRGAEGFLFLGDLVSDCARPCETLAIVRETLAAHPGCAILGNREETLLAAHHGRMKPLRGSMGFTQHCLTDGDWRFLEALSGPRLWEAGEGLPPLQLCHGAPDKTRGTLFPGSGEARYWSVHAEADMLLCGHTHVPFAIRPFRACLVNCGTVGVPCDGDPRASFALLYGEKGSWRAELLRVPYDPEPEIAAMRTCGLTDWDPVWAAAVAAHLRDGREWCGVMLDLAVELARADGLPEGQPLPDEYREKAAKALGLL